MSFPTGQQAQSSQSLDCLPQCRQLKFSDIQEATKNFDESLVIGHGGFGKVYRGTITNGESLLEVAIKRLDTTSNQGAEEFWAEVEMLSKLRHCNLVSLIGYCNNGKEMILVYEYMPNGNLSDRLHKSRYFLTWMRRLKISIGAARGLEYLHTGTGIRQGVVHRDVKSSNILLDGSWASKVSDFGLSKIVSTNQPTTYVNTLVKGSFGYIDPNYFQTGKLTRKSDVYAFGVILFELLCGRKALDTSLDEEQMGLASWAQDSVKKGRLKQIVDSKLSGAISSKCMNEFAQLANRCLDNHPKERPTMAEVVVVLESILAREKTNKSSLPLDRKIFGIKVPAFGFPSSHENSEKPLHVSENNEETIQLPMFSFSAIATATENFSTKNILGEGGFGRVYKGVLEEGQEIAVKRLSIASTQGVDEFKNEVILISKLQHQNLVKLLGYCIKVDEKLLIYEYMPNKSLDTFIFAKTEIMLLDWTTRFNIINGIARGLLHLHYGSQIIIHRDLKASNILLDHDMNPKISDFGLARCFGGNETQTNTSRIVGTYGYMAPEYALHGLFSIKSDVFSFGVLMLEIVTGKKNTSFFPEHGYDLPGYAWSLYNEGRAMEMIHASLAECVNPPEVLRSIQVGLLCVQDNAGDRPNISSVVLMLSSDGALPQPKQPAFFTGTESRVADFSSNASPSGSINDLTVTVMDAR